VSGLLERAAVTLVPRDNPAAAVYGLLAIGGLLAAESGRGESYLDTVLSIVIAACIYWLVHAYSEALGRRLGSGERLTPAAVVRALIHAGSLLWGAALPICALLIAWAAGAAQETAVTIGMWFAVGGLVVFELVAALRARAAPSELAIQVGVGLALGIAVLALKVILH
jgi:hypothetical protein